MSIGNFVGVSLHNSITTYCILLLLLLRCLVGYIAFEKGMKLPGSRPDVVRKFGQNPVGGTLGGAESQRVMLLDDFEMQAAHYNMACAHARLGNLDEVGTTIFAETMLFVSRFWIGNGFRMRWEQKWPLFDNLS